MASGLSSGQKPTGVTDLDSVQTLENKTLDSSSSVNGAPITGSDIISPTRADVKKDTLANLQTYALTAANGQLCFATDAKKMYQVLDAALAEVGTGSGGINYIPNPDFELNADGWVGDTNLTIARSTSNPLRGDASGVISKAAVDASGEVVRTIPITIDAADLAKKLYISADVDASDANYADGDLRWKIVKDPNGTPVTIRPNAEDILGGDFTRLAWFQSDATITEYELQIECNSANTSAYSIKIDNVSVGPREAVFGSAMTDWKSYTPTFTGFGTPTNVDFSYRRVGDSLEIRGYCTSGISTATEARISLPDNLTTSSSIATLQPVGSHYNSKGTADKKGAPVLVEPSVTYLTFGHYASYGTGAVNPLSKANGNEVVENGDTFSFHAALVPIQGWSSNALMSEDIGNRDVKVYAVGNAGQSISADSTAIPFESVTDTTASWSGDTFTCPESGDYIIDGCTSGTVAHGGTVYVYNTTDSIIEKFIATNNISASIKNFAGTLPLVKGKQYILRASASFTCSQSSEDERHYLMIKKLAQPQTLLETETVAARYTSDSGQNIPNIVATTVIHEDIDFDTHNAYNTSTGEYTIPLTGKYIIKAKVAYDSFAAVAGMKTSIYLNGVEISSTYNLATNTSYIYGAPIDDILDLEKGDVISIVLFQNSGSSRNLIPAGGVANMFSIARIK
jgi:hypothetical protein